MQRRRLMMPPHPVLAPLAWQVLTTPPTDEEIHLLTEVVEEAQGAEPRAGRDPDTSARYRIWYWLKVIAKNDVRIATDLMLLLMIIDTLLRFFPSQPPPQPAPQVTVNVTVDADEIAEKVAKRLEDEGSA
jgi:hypothetical protein